MAAGFLSGKYEKGKEPLEGARFSLGSLGYKYNLKYWNDLNFTAVQQLEKIARDHGKTLPQFALAWVLSNKTITSIVCGATSLEQLENNLKPSKSRFPRKNSRPAMKCGTTSGLPGFSTGGRTNRKERENTRAVTPW
jgi:aryl-alcohol dehydrogenase-like predicted oxidoreductase